MTPPPLQWTRPGQEVTPAAGVGVRGQLLMSPCTPDVCWVGPGRARRRPPPRRCWRRWSSWCRPCCRDRRCSEEDFYCEREEHTSYWESACLCPTGSQTGSSSDVLFDFLHTGPTTACDDSLALNVFLGERDVLDQHGRLRAEEDSQQRLKHNRVGQHEARGHGRGHSCLNKIQLYCHCAETPTCISRAALKVQTCTGGVRGQTAALRLVVNMLNLLNHSHLQSTGTILLTDYY